MKCFSYFLLFLFFHSFTVLGGENFVDPKTNTEFSTGDIGELVITSELSSEELKQFVHKKITNIIYVLDFQEDENGRSFQVVFTAPPTKELDKIFPFVMRNINYNFDKDRVAQNFNLFKSNYVPMKKQSYIFIIILCLLVLILIIIFSLLLSRYIKLRRTKKELRNKSRLLIEQFNNSSSRPDLEFLYSEKEKFFKYTNIEQEKWNLFEKELNKVQFKREWSEEDLKLVLLKKKEIGALRRKDGI